LGPCWAQQRSGAWTACSARSNAAGRGQRNNGSPRER
jgi:hypothetical protein